MIKLVATAILAVAALTWSGPANADSIRVGERADDSYTNPAQAWVEPAVISPGGRAVITFTAGFFEPSEAVTAKVTGRSADDARVYARGFEAGGSAMWSREDGSLSVIFVAPTSGSGAYVISFAASREYVAVVTVVRDDPRPGTEIVLPKPPAQVPTLPDLSPGSSSPATPPRVTPTHHFPSAADQSAESSAHALPDRTPTEPAFGSAHGGPATTPEKPAAPDREGRVEIPRNLLDTPGWPDLGGIPWSIILLAAIALIVTTVAATLAIAARRRG